MRKRVSHFFLGGLALFVVDSIWSEPVARFELGDALRDAPIVVTQARLTQLRKNFRAASGATGDLTPEEEAVLVSRAVDEEILYREAIARGMHLHDRSVRYRMVQKMRFVVGHATELTDDELYERAVELELDHDDAIIRRLITEKVKLLIKFGTPMPAPDDDALVEYLTRNADRYMQPAIITFSQIYFSNDVHDDGTEEAARTALSALVGRSRDDVVDERRGDRFPWGDRFEKRSPRSIERTFGTDFANAVFEQRVGEWTGPISSSFGYHLVFVDERIDERIAELDEVRRQVQMALVTEKREARLQQVLSDLRARYEVQIQTKQQSDAEAQDAGEPQS